MEPSPRRSQDLYYYELPVGGKTPVFRLQGVARKPLWVTATQTQGRSATDTARGKVPEAGLTRAQAKEGSRYEHVFFPQGSEGGKSVNPSAWPK